VFVFVDLLFEFAQCRGLTPPLEPQAAGLSIEGRAVPDTARPSTFWQPRRSRRRRPLLALTLLCFSYLYCGYML
jgi:hypothetical protein